MKPILMGIINLTEDSFYESSPSFEAKAAAHVSGGVDILDLGAESTRPGAAPVEEEEEIRRLVPAVKKLKNLYPNTLISVDTYRARAASACLDAGADIINDISAASDVNTALAAARANAKIILMHMRGTPQTMDSLTDYKDILSEIKEFFTKRINVCLMAGVKRENIILDPGFGFAKTAEQNIFLLKNLDFLSYFGLPVLAGVSRKRFLSDGADTPADRLPATIAANILAYQKGASIFRVHDVLENKRALNFAQKVTL